MTHQSGDRDRELGSVIRRSMAGIPKEFLRRKTLIYNWTCKLKGVVYNTICGESMCRFIASRVSENRSYKPLRPM